ncbi:hypothetical protein D3C71_1306770 [compost metagenome]
MEGLAVVLSNEAEVQISEIVIDRATAGQTTYNLNIILFNIFLIDFFNRILMFTDDDRWAVNIKKQVTLVHRQVFQRIFLNRQIDGSVSNPCVINKNHSEFLRCSKIDYSSHFKPKAVF